jgi:hypothetical protein
MPSDTFKIIFAYCSLNFNINSEATKEPIPTLWRLILVKLFMKKETRTDIQLPSITAAKTIGRTVLFLKLMNSHRYTMLTTIIGPTLSILSSMLKLLIILRFFINTIETTGITSTLTKV